MSTLIDTSILARSVHQADPNNQLAVAHLRQVLGKAAHDARLVASMHVHGINQILTFNTQDFKRFQTMA